MNDEDMFDELFFWLSPTKLSGAQFAKLCGLLPRATPQQHGTLARAIERATDLQQITDRDPPATDSDTRDHLHEIGRLLKKVATVKGAIHSYDRIRLHQEAPFMRWLEDTQAAIEAMHQDYASHKTGPPPCYRYTHSLSYIARVFEQVFERELKPLRVSAGGTSVFCKVAAFWFGQVLRVNSSAVYEIRKMIKLRGELEEKS